LRDHSRRASDLKTRAEQVECYEDRVGEVLGARDNVQRGAKDEPATPSEAAGEAAVAATASDEPREEPVAAAASDEPDDAAGEIIAIVTDVRELEPNAYLIHLDNDQVWRQNRPKRYLLRVGAEVHLKPTHWGPSYRLTVPDQRSFIQVERVR
jgi:hypothetical protein